MGSVVTAGAVLSVLLLAGGVAARADEIGVTSAAHNEVIGTLNGATAPLTAGNAIFQNQIVSTGDESAAQLLFLDETSLDLGPNSEVTLDRFVYDPATRSGDIVLQTTRGVFRFVTGSADPNSYAIRTESATIGFRGSIVDIIGNPLTFICVQEIVIVVLPDGTEIPLHNGDALTINEDGTIQGPFTWFGPYNFVIGGISLPLYSNGFLAEPHRIDLPDGKVHVIDEKESQFEDDEGDGECCIECCYD